ncbi:hypothetical protein CDD83_6363 [Cordyceps sp. RAO-2017]|nr:hypothetical protein CDD83_6363 [Cordyceps sp. RAO-2017]
MRLAPGTHALYTPFPHRPPTSQRLEDGSGRGLNDMFHHPSDESHAKAATAQSQLSVAAGRAGSGDGRGARRGHAALRHGNQCWSAQGEAVRCGRVSP